MVVLFVSFCLGAGVGHKVFIVILCACFFLFFSFCIMFMSKDKIFFKCLLIEISTKPCVLHLMLIGK